MKKFLGIFLAFFLIIVGIFGYFHLQKNEISNTENSGNFEETNKNVQKFNKNEKNASMPEIEKIKPQNPEEYMKNPCSREENYFIIEDFCSTQIDERAYVYNMENPKYQIFDEKTHIIHNIIDGEKEYILADEKFVRNLQKIYKNFKKEIKNKNNSEIDEINQKYFQEIASIITQTENATEGQFWKKLLLKIESYTIFAKNCKGDFCDLEEKIIEKETDKTKLFLHDLGYFFEKNITEYSISLDNGKKLVYEQTFPGNSSCMWGRTWLEENGEKFMIIDDIELPYGRGLCTIEASFLDNNTIALEICYNSGYSGECEGMSFLYEIDKKKLSYIGLWDYSFSRRFSLEAAKHRAKINRDEINKNTLETIEKYKKHRENPHNEEVKYYNEESFLQNKEYLQGEYDKFLKISEFMKNTHNLDIGDFWYSKEIMDFFEIQ